VFNQEIVAGFVPPLRFQLAQRRSMLEWCTQNSASCPAYGTAPMFVAVPVSTWMRLWMPESIARQKPCTPETLT
jgi:hypothetical protein